jgi:hypothetical protein
METGAKVQTRPPVSLEPTASKAPKHKGSSVDDFFVPPSNKAPKPPAGPQSLTFTDRQGVTHIQPVSSGKTEVPVTASKSPASGPTGQGAKQPQQKPSGATAQTLRESSNGSVKSLTSRSSVSSQDVQTPYNPYTMRSDLEAVYGRNAVSSTTLAKHGTKGSKLANQKHLGSDVVYDVRANPIFDEHTLYQTILKPENFYGLSRKTQMKNSTLVLKEDIKNGYFSKDSFTTDQIKAIEGQSSKIPGYTWHHHESSRMQLVKEGIHDAAPHTGSFSRTKFPQKNEGKK